MRIRDIISEVPVADYEPIGDFSKGASFNYAPDRGIVQSPKAQAKLYKFFERTPYELRLYPINVKGGRNFTEHGEVDLAWLEKNLPQAAEVLKQKGMGDDTITIFYVSNTGAEKKPFTPWIMAHRLGHAIKNQWGWKEYQDYLFGQLNDILENFYGVSQKRGNYDRALLSLINSLGTMRSARTNNIKRPYEFGYELLAQYLNANEIKLNPLPARLASGRTVVAAIPQDALEEARDYHEMLERDLDYYLDAALGNVVNKIFVM